MPGRLFTEVAAESPASFLGRIRELGEIDAVEVVLQHSKLDLDDVRWGIEKGAYFYLTTFSDPTLLRAMIRAEVERRLANPEAADRRVQVSMSIAT